MLYFRALIERLPFQATAAGASYERIRSLPVSVLLDNVRSLYNVGSFFRTADAAGLEKLYLCGITGHPPGRAIGKTALGVEESVPWEHSWAPLSVLRSLRAAGREIAAIETSIHGVRSGSRQRHRDLGHPRDEWSHDGGARASLIVT